MMTGFALLVMTICLGAFALSAVDWLVARWVRLYTWLLPPEIRDRRREEIRSDLFEHRREEAADGYKPVEIAARMLLRWILGIPGDVSWSAGQYLHFRRVRKTPHAVERPPAAGDQLWPLLITHPSDHSIQITMSADPEAVPVVAGTRADPRAYLVHGLPIVRGPKGDGESWTAAQAQLRAIWGDELVVDSTPEASSPSRP